MCARRFLFLILFLTLLGVAGAFAIFQFGDRALTSMATPKGHFSPPPKRDEPDYSKDQAWLAKPGMAENPSDWVPDGVAPVPSDRQAVTFYIHPTTYLERDRWNAPFDVGGKSLSRARLFVRSQASAFNQVSSVWAPRYRQAAFGAFLLKSDDATKALNLAYADVLRAFDAFLVAQKPEAPIILAAHSQGALHLSRLLIDRKDALNGRLVAAYVAGWPLSSTADLPATGRTACSSPDQSGCIVSWQSFAEPANPSLITDAWLGTSGPGGERKRKDMVCVNPLTGTIGGSAVATTNFGTLVPDAKFGTASLAIGQVGARCDKGFLIIDGAAMSLGPYVLPGNNYHVYDYALFWGSIRADAARRLAAWQAR